MTFTQAEFDIRCEWGAQGVAALAPACDVVIVVDVLSFSTSVDIATSRGATVFAYSGPAEGAASFAAAVGAHLAQPQRSLSGYTLSPSSLLTIEPGTRLVLPSPNGSTLSLGAGTTPVLAGCLRNARAVAAAAQRFGQAIGVIPAGERWRPDGALRPSFEDLVGAGAIISYLAGALSPEATGALGAFRVAAPRLSELVRACGSGKELIARGFAEDVALAVELDASQTAPLLRDGAYSAFESPATQ